jgi:hypothetical protein
MIAVLAGPRERRTSRKTGVCRQQVGIVMRMNRFTLSLITADRPAQTGTDLLAPVLIDEAVRGRQRARLARSVQEFVDQNGQLPVDQVESIAERASLWA